ncbi:hypothetical protein JRO89_XS03G0048900 [Xanthoceras sorbifolium]|uniref:Zinc-hook domain-containing protein n=1 Tax=Xanthoceras sorbifolium TaxID=99658 RepID=A0ABQ8I8Q6_9ROSI|nr:hypothetical protein JRO89_XS03G0048900 [Xanthoceras sorbifolium]
MAGPALSPVMTVSLSVIEELRESIAQDEEKTESLKNQMDGLERNIQDVDAKIHYTEATLEDLRKIQDQISTKTAQRSTLFKEQQKQYAALAEENEDTDEELKEWKTKFEERIAILENKISKLEREMKDKDTESSALNKAIINYISEISKLEIEAKAHMALKDERDSTIQKLFARHNLGSLPNAPFSNEAALSFTNRIESRLKDLEKDLDDKKKSNELELKMAWDSYLAANDRWNSIQAQQKAKVEIKSGILKRIEEKESERDSFELQISNVDISRIDERENNMRIEVERKTNQLAEREFESNICQKQSELYSIDQNINALNREKDIMAGDSEDRVKLSLKKAELENHKKKHKKIIDDYKDKIRGVLKGRLPPEKDLKKEITQALRALVMEFNDLNSKSLEAKNEVNMLQMKIQEVNDNMSKHRKDVDSRKRFIESKLVSLNQQFMSIDDYQKVLESAKEKRDVQKSKYNIADGMRQMFDPFERVARAHHVCPCCERPFAAEEEDEFIKKQRVKAASSAEHMKVLARESSSADSLFQQLDKLRMVYEEYIKISKETISHAEKNLHELTEELDQKSQSYDDFSTYQSDSVPIPVESMGHYTPFATKPQKEENGKGGKILCVAALFPLCVLAQYLVLGVLAQIKADKESVEALVQPVEAADRLFQEIQTCQKQVIDLEYMLDSRGQGVRTMEDIQLELNSVQSTKDTLHKELEKLRYEQRYMENDLSNIQIRWHTLREEKVKAANTLRDVKKAEEELERLAEEKSQVELDEKHLAEALGSLSKEKEKLLNDYDDLKVKLSRENEELAEQKRNYQQEIKTLLETTTKIKEYYHLKKGERLNELQEKKSLSESQLQSCDVRKQEILAELNKSKDLMRNQDQLRRNIEDNLNYRTTKAEVDELASEIESLEEKILNIGGVLTVKSKHEKLSQERLRLLSELDRCRGRMSVHESNISDNKIDLKQAKYKDIDKRYFDQLIKLKTTEMANKDLDRYYNALDKALMRFHSMKMEEINKIIRELWQQTYRGQDIDYICIHSDSEGAGTRSYSYKVLMQTGDTELEMRGRCSAGQKVLASLIIRLALAETFCLNCGVLALDEPTTNLDGPNAESLAAALLRHGQIISV